MSSVPGPLKITPPVSVSVDVSRLTVPPAIVVLAAVAPPLSVSTPPLTTSAPLTVAPAPAVTLPPDWMVSLVATAEAPLTVCEPAMLSALADP